MKNSNSHLHSHLSIAPSLISRTCQHLFEHNLLTFYSSIMSLPNAQNFVSTLCLFPLPHQLGAPYFDGKDVTDFLIKWEDLTLDWSDNQRIKKIPLYSDKLIGRCLKTQPTYTVADWDEFKDVLLEEFKDDDEQQKRNTEAYLQCLVQHMRKEKNPTAGRYRAFISNSQNELLSWLTEP